MTMPILQAKLTVPPMPEAYLPRPRLDQRWRDCGEATSPATPRFRPLPLRFSWVAAGAG